MKLKPLKIASIYLASAQNDQLQQAVIKMVPKVEKAFNFPGLAKGIEWRTAEHPDFAVASANATRSTDAEGFITADNKIYLINLKTTLDNFVVHELGHILDRRLNNISRSFSGTKDKPSEAFAEMVDYVVINKHSGGHVQTAMYNAACDRLGITKRVPSGEQAAKTKASDPWYTPPKN